MLYHVKLLPSSKNVASSGIVRVQAIPYLRFRYQFLSYDCKTASKTEKCMYIIFIADKTRKKLIERLLLQNGYFVILILSF